MQDRPGRVTLCHYVLSRMTRLFPMTLAMLILFSCAEKAKLFFIRHGGELGIDFQNTIVTSDTLNALTFVRMPHTKLHHKDAVGSRLFTVNDKNSKSLGQFSGSSMVGFARKYLKESTSWFMSLPADDPKFWTYIFENAGVHIFTDSQDIIYGCEGALTIHTRLGGGKSIKLRNGKSVSFEMPANSTWVLDDKTGEVIID